MLRIAIVTVSDSASRGEREDLGGPALAEAVERVMPAAEILREILPDDRRALARRLSDLSDSGIDLLLTTGGTGLSPRDRTPEAVRDVVEIEIPGLAERMRQATGERFPPAYLSRQVAGGRGKTLILAFPGSPRGAVECFEAVAELLPHAIALLAGGSAPHPTR